MARFASRIPRQFLGSPHSPKAWVWTEARTWAWTGACCASSLCLLFPLKAHAQSGASETLKPVVVTGSRSERELQDVPAAIDLLQGDDLDSAKVQDIRDLVRELPNVSVARQPQRFNAVNSGAVGNGRAGNAGFNIRGLEGNRVLLTVDGIRVPRELSSGVFGSAAFGRDYYDLGLISRVEILRGASSALYGSDGLAGMVAMFTTEPKDLLKTGQALGGQTLAGRVGLRLDSEDGSRGIGATLAGAASERLQWLGSVQVGRSRELDNQGGDASLNSNRTAPNPQRDRQMSVLGKLVFEPSAASKHILALEHVDRSGEVEGYTGRSTSAIGVQDLDGTSEMQRTRLSWDGRFKTDMPWARDLRALLAYQVADSQQVATEQRTVVPNLRQRVVTYEEKLVQGVLQAEATRALSVDWSQKTVYGVDLSVTTLDNLVTGIAPPRGESYPLQRFPRTRETTGALFVQSEFASNRWSVIPALRYDRFSLKPQSSPLYPLSPSSLSGSALTPKLGVIWRSADDWSLFGNLAAGFKAPSPLQLNNFFENVFGNYRTLPNPDLKPERSRTAEFGARGNSNNTQWEATVFAGRYKDFIEDLVQVGGTGAPGSPILFQSINRGQVRLSGFEFKGKTALGAATRLRWGYGQTKGTDTALNQPLNSVNPPKLVLGVDHTWQDWTVGATLIHVASKSAKDINNTLTGGQQQFATPAHTTLDLSASWRLRPGLKFSAAVRNLTDRKHWDWTNVRGVAASSPVLDAYTAPGRSVSVALVSAF
jgi:hemoglobin/transferrin/lactoferrin receptor protein